MSLCQHVCCRLYAPGCLEHLSCGSRRRAVCQGCPVRMSQKGLPANSLVTVRRKGFRLPWTTGAEQTPERNSARAVNLLLRRLHRPCRRVLSPFLLVHALRSGRDSKRQQGSVSAKCMHPALPISHALEALPLAHAFAWHKAQGMNSMLAQAACAVPDRDSNEYCVPVDCLQVPVGGPCKHLLHSLPALTIPTLHDATADHRHPRACTVQVPRAFGTAQLLFSVTLQHINLPMPESCLST